MFYRYPCLSSCDFIPCRFAEPDFRATAPAKKRAPKQAAAKPKAAKAAKPAKVAGKKAKKDPNAPKRPRSAYIFFSNDVRPNLAKKHPGEPITELSKRIGEQWRNASDADKKKYETQAAKDKVRYERESKAYKA